MAKQITPAPFTCTIRLRRTPDCWEALISDSPIPDEWTPTPYLPTMDIDQVCDALDQIPANKGAFFVEETL